MMNNNLQWFVMSEITVCHTLKVCRLQERGVTLSSLGYKVVNINCKKTDISLINYSLGYWSPFNCDLTTKEDNALILVHC